MTFQRYRLTGSNRRRDYTFFAASWISLSRLTFCILLLARRVYSDNITNPEHVFRSVSSLLTVEFDATL